jgi:hypothetical protein
VEQVPVASELIVSEGVSALTLEGITFEHSAWDAPASDDGYLERYGGVRFLACNASAAKETNRCYRLVSHWFGWLGPIAIDRSSMDFDWLIADQLIGNG